MDNIFGIQPQEALSITREFLVQYKNDLLKQQQTGDLYDSIRIQIIGDMLNELPEFI